MFTGRLVAEGIIWVIGSIIVAVLVVWERGASMGWLVLVLVLLMLMLRLVLSGKGAWRRFAVACGTRLGAAALLLLPLTQIASARDALSLLCRPHLAEMCCPA